MLQLHSLQLTFFNKVTKVQSKENHERNSAFLVCLQNQKNKTV